MASMLYLLVALSVCLSCVHGDPSNQFNNPTGTGLGAGYASDMVWQVGSMQTLSWTTTFTGYYTVDLWQQNLNQQKAYNSSTIFSSYSAPGQQSFNWKVGAPNADISYSPVFFLWIHGASVDISSYYFNITDPSITTTKAAVAAPTTTSTTTSVSSTSSASQATTLTQSVTSATASSAASSNLAGSNTGSTATSATPAASSTTLSQAGATTGSENDTSTKVAIGVGVGLGVPLLVIAVIFATVLWMKRRKRNQVEEMAPAYTRDYHYGTPRHELGAHLSQNIHEKWAGHSGHELPHQADPYELPAVPPKGEK